MRIFHVSYSSSGGAGTVARLLHEQQLKEGLDSTLVTRIDSDLRSSPMSDPAGVVAAAIDQWVIKSSSFTNQISLMRNRLKRFDLNSIPSDSVIHVHWTPGLIATEQLSELIRFRRVVVTLHDMFPITGTCHFSGKCALFETGCQDCPAVKKPFRGQVSALHAKKISFLQSSNVTLAAPSSWMLDKALSSQISFSNPPEQINNPVNPVFFDSLASAERKPGKSLRLVAVAANLDDPRKRIDEIVQAFHAVKNIRGNIELSLVGAGGSKYKNIEGVSLQGSLKPLDLAKLFWECDAGVSAAKDENASLSILEGAATGLSFLVPRQSGSEEITNKLGLGSSFSTASDLCERITKLSPLSNSERSAKHLVVLNEFGVRIVSSEYLRLFSN